jgi:predicted CXXCH cytochrome family protein
MKYLLIYVAVLFTLVTVPRGPHFDAGRCGDCHGKAGPEQAEAAGGLKNLYNRLCLECHETLSVTCRFHAAIVPDGEAIGLPLKDGRFYCLTCHDARIQCVKKEDPAAKANPLFLRGNPAGGVKRFCFACHEPKRYRIFKVHAGMHLEAEAGRCLYCHGKPEGKRRGCRACHAVGDHPGGADHRVSMGDLETVLPLGEGRRIECRTCHDPHADQENRRHLLRLERANFCDACHVEEME